jgi:hypothetical protein
MIDKFFTAVMTAMLLILFAAIMSASLTGSEHAVDFRPVFQFFLKASGQFDYAAGMAYGKVPDVAPNKKIADVAKERVAQTKKEIKQTTDENKVPLAQPRTDTNKVDPRLAVCPNGSVEPRNAKEIRLAQAESFKSQYGQKKVKSFMEVQGLLGEPACNSTNGKIRKWRFLVPGKKAIDVSGDEKSLEAKFTGW